MKMETTTIFLELVYNISDNTTLAQVSRGQDCSPLAKLVINTIFAGLVCIFGFISNTVSFVVLTKDKATPVATFSLQALVLCDNFFLCAWFLQYPVNDLFDYLHVSAGVPWLYVRLYTYPLTFIGQTATIWMTVLIAASRYIAVCIPYKASKYCSLPVVKKGVIAVAVFSVLYNLPRYFEATVSDVAVKANSTLTYTTLIRTSMGNHSLYATIYFDVLYYIFSFVLPLMLLAYLNTRLTVAYRVVQKKRSTMRMRQDGHDNNITLVMIIVVLVFILCNAPARIVQIIYGYQVLPCPSPAFLISIISNVLEVLNSSANFIIYCIFRKQFRDILRTKVCDCIMTAEHDVEMTITGTTAVNGTAAQPLTQKDHLDDG